MSRDRESPAGAITNERPARKLGSRNPPPAHRRPGDRDGHVPDALLQLGNNVGIEVPEDILHNFGAGKRVPVTVDLDGQHLHIINRGSDSRRANPSSNRQPHTRDRSPGLSRGACPPASQTAAASVWAVDEQGGFRKADYVCE